MVKERHPPIADMMIRHLQERQAPSFLSVMACAQRLVEAGFDMLSWDELSRAPPTLQEDPEPNQPNAGWQQKATRSWRRGSSETRCGLHWTTESTVAISARASGIITPHGTTHIKGNQDGRPTLPPPLVPTSAFAPSFCLFVPADVATSSIRLATIVQRALRQGCWAAGGSH